MLRALVSSCFSRMSISKILFFCSRERKRCLLSHLHRTLRRRHNLMQIFPVASSVEVWWEQLSLTSLSTSSCSNNHFSKWNLLCWSWFSLDSRHRGTWFEVVLSRGLRSARGNLLSQPSQIRTLSNLARFEFSLISDHVNLQLLSGRSVSLSWVITSLKVSLSQGWRTIPFLLWANLIMLKSSLMIQGESHLVLIFLISS